MLNSVDSSRMPQLACSPCPPNILLCCFVWDLHAFVLIAYTFVGMSELPWPFRAISVECLSSRPRFPLWEVCLYICWECLGSRAQFVRVLGDVSAPVLALPPSAIVVAVVVVAARSSSHSVSYFTWGPRSQSHSVSYFTWVRVWAPREIH